MSNFKIYKDANGSAEENPKIIQVVRVNDEGDACPSLQATVVRFRQIGNFDPAGPLRTVPIQNFIVEDEFNTGKENKRNAENFMQNVNPLPSLITSNAVNKTKESRRYSELCQGKEASPEFGRNHFFNVPTYQDDFLCHLRLTEKRFPLSPNFLAGQATDISAEIRRIVIDWISYIIQQLKLCSETFFLAARHFDRYINTYQIKAHELKLLAMAAILMAAKNEEVKVPEMKVLIAITDGACTVDELIMMEVTLLKALNFDLASPTIIEFLNAYIAICEIPSTIKFLALYVCELSVLECSKAFIVNVPSKIAAAGLAYAQYALGYNVIWSEKLEETTNYRVEELKSLILALNDCHVNINLNQRAIFDKYNTVDFCNVSSLVAPTILNSRCLEDAIISYYKHIGSIYNPLGKLETKPAE